KGLGVTTDGDLLYVADQLQFTLYSVFEDEADYNRLAGLSTWELHTKAPEGETANLLEEFEGLEDMVVVLYLEHYPQKSEVCDALECDNQGCEEVARLHYLLIAREDVETSVQAGDSIYHTYETNRKADANLRQDLPLRRVKNLREVTSLEQLQAAFRQAVLGSTIVSLPFSSHSSIIQARAWIESLHFDFLNPSIGSSALLETYFDPVFSNEVNWEHHFQYLFEHLQHLCQACRELREVLFDWCFECCPDPNAFSKHLLLGPLSPGNAAGGFSYRHRFYPSPIHTDGQQKLQLARSLFRRLERMIIDFEVPKVTEIRITPGKNRPTRLASRPIPYFYDVSDNRDSDELILNWDYPQTLRGRGFQARSYFGQDYGGSEDVAHPLEFSLDDSDFFRIEGHIGRLLSGENGEGEEGVMQQLEALRAEYNLPFDTICLSLAETESLDDFDFDKYKAYFEDLNAVLAAMMAEPECLDKKAALFFSSVSIKEPGRHLFFGPATGPEAGPTVSGGVRPDITIGSGGTVFIGAQGSGNAVVNPSLSGGSVFVGGSTALANLAAGLAGGRVPLLPPYFFYAPNLELIQSHLNTSEDAFGSLVFPIFNDYPTETIEFWDSKLREVIEEVKEREEWKDVDAATIEIVLEFPARLLSRLNYAIRYYPANVGQVSADPGLIENLTASIDKTCTYAQSVKRKTSPIFDTQDYQKTGFEADYTRYLEQLYESCCINDKIEAIQKEIEARKSELISQFFFSSFAANHPGMEHTGGVPRGGTFVLAYSDTDQRVVADFCLPYTCCSNLPPLAFVLPKPVVSLLLARSYVCWDPAAPGRVDILEVYPSDGIVKADKGEPGLVTQDENGRHYIDLSVVTESLLGQAIGFTINDQVTAATLTVYYKTVPKFTAIIPDTPSGDYQPGKYIMVSFTNETEPASASLNYEWDLGDGKSSTSFELKHKYNLKELPGPRVEVAVTLKARHGQCEEETTQTLVLEDCTAGRKSQVEQDKDFLENDVGPNVPSGFATLYSNPSGDPGTLQLYEQVIQSPDKYTSGQENVSLIHQLSRLLDATAAAVLTPGRTDVSPGQLYLYQLRLFLNVLFCQKSLSITTTLSTLMGNIKSKAEQLTLAFPEVFQDPAFIQYLQDYLRDMQVQSEAYQNFIKELISIYSTTQSPQDTCTEERKKAIVDDGALVDAITSLSDVEKGDTRVLFVTVSKNIEAFTNGDRNENLGNGLIKLFRETAMGVYQSADLDKRNGYARMYGLQFKLLLNVLFCQEGLSVGIAMPDPIKEALDEFKAYMSDFLPENYTAMNPNGEIRTFLKGYLDNMVGDQGTLRSILEGILAMIPIRSRNQ
ncbi:MAG: hypothetical protein KDD10_19510, partial [Phaeodactylibacter sp.]|nr:hypothetical protein [Phaeodactylibacter sp.]